MDLLTSKDFRDKPLTTQNMVHKPAGQHHLGTTEMQALKFLPQEKKITT